MQNKPLVSIVIPVYNGSNYVKEAIDSALAQTYENIEIIVVNDGSKDDGATEKIALSYGDKIRYFHKENGGVSSALNVGIANMRGEYFSWLSHDDKYAPEKIENQISVLMRQNNKRLLALCGTRQIDKNSQFLQKAGEEKRFGAAETVGWENAIKSLFNEGCYNGCAFLIPKSAFDECGGFDESLRYTQDMLMWIKIFLKGYGIVYNSSADSLMRVHDGQLTQRGRDMFKRNSEEMSNFLMPELGKAHTKENGLLYWYAKYNAKYAVDTVWKSVLKKAKEEKLLTLSQRGKIRMVAIYGGVRPFIRKIYYRVFKKVKTQ